MQCFILRLLFPNRGAWLEYETGSAGVLRVRVEVNQKASSLTSPKSDGTDQMKKSSIFGESCSLARDIREGQHQACDIDK